MLATCAGDVKLQLACGNLSVACMTYATKGVWRNGSASDSRSEGWEFESLCPHVKRYAIALIFVELLRSRPA
jgi:hypothetical protein